MKIDSQIMRDFGSRLASERKRLGYTQASLAETLGITRVTQQKYEKGNPPSIEYLYCFEGLGGDVGFLINGSGTSRSEIPAAFWNLLEDFQFRLLAKLAPDLDVGIRFQVAGKAKVFAKVMQGYNFEHMEPRDLWELLEILTKQETRRKGLGRGLPALLKE